MMSDEAWKYTSITCNNLGLILHKSPVKIFHLARKWCSGEELAPNFFFTKRSFEKVFRGGIS